MLDVEAIAARRAAATEANQAANAATTKAAAEHLRRQDAFCRLIEPGNFTLSDDQAQQAIRDVAQAIRDGGRMPRFEAAEKIATTDDRAFVVAIVRQALDSGASATELGRQWNGAKTGGSLCDAANWLYDQVGFGHWKEAPRVPGPADADKAPADDRPDVSTAIHAEQAVSTAADLMRIGEAVGDSNTVEALRIASDGNKSADEKMEMLIKLDTKFAGKGSPDWAFLLKVSEQAIRKCPTWKRLQEAKNC